MNKTLQNNVYSSLRLKFHIGISSLFAKSIVPLRNHPADDSAQTIREHVVHKPEKTNR